MKSDLDRMVGGLRCRDVLELLADYVDGELLPADRLRVDAHLEQCDNCEKFGGEYAALVRSLRQRPRHATSAAPGLRERLGRRMELEWGDRDQDH